MSASIIGFPDMQIPFHDWKAVIAACEFAKTKHWDYAILMGDNVDFDYLSRYVEGLPGKVEGRQLKEDFSLASDILRSSIFPAVRHVNSNCKIYVFEGNHEKRIKHAYNKHKYLEGMFDFADMLDLEEHNATWVECDSVGELLRFEWRRGIKPRIYKPGERIASCEGVTFLHGKYHNVYHARKHLQEYRIGPLYYGHLHDVQRMTIKGYGSQTIRGGSCGCLCQLDMEYLEGLPNKWQQAICEWQLSDEPGRYTDPVHYIEEGKIVGSKSTST